MAACKCRSKRRCRIVKPGLVQRDNIHIALAEQYLRPPGLPCEVEPVQVPAFVEYFRFRGIQIFRLAFPHKPAAESDDFMMHIHNRKHRTVPEFIMRAAFFIYGNQAGIPKQPVIIAF